MKLSKLHVSPRAKRDLAERAKYLEAEAGLHVAESFIDSAARTMELLRLTPGMGKAFRSTLRPHNEFRYVPISGAFRAWLIVYSVNKSAVRIERITHAAQDIRRFLP